MKTTRADINVPSDAEIGGRKLREQEKLFVRYSGRVLGYLYRLTGNRTEAEDLTQETFLAAFLGQERFEGRAQPLTWLIGIARRRWRDTTRRPPMLTGTAQPESVSNEFPPERIALTVTLAEALAKLPERERDVLLLTVVQELSYREAAEILEAPVGTVKWRAHEATKQLRKILTAADERYEAQYGIRDTPRNAGSTKPARTTTRADVSPRQP